MALVIHSLRHSPIVCKTNFILNSLDTSNLVLNKYKQIFELNWNIAASYSLISKQTLKINCNDIIPNANISMKSNQDWFLGMSVIFHSFLLHEFYKFSAHSWHCIMRFAGGKFLTKINTNNSWNYFIFVFQFVVFFFSFIFKLIIQFQASYLIHFENDGWLTLISLALVCLFVFRIDSIHLLQKPVWYIFSENLVCRFEFGGKVFQ